MKLLGARVGIVGLLLALGARGQDTGSGDAGATRCHQANDCAPPTPYCDTARSECVQCVGDMNCAGIASVCDTTRGVCTNCRANTDCYGQTPYCSSTLNGCVECLSDGNCGKLGIKCVDGVCGSCGDGICSDKERNSFYPCVDCLSGCPSKDLQSKV